MGLFTHRQPVPFAAAKKVRIKRLFPAKISDMNEIFSLTKFFSFVNEFFMANARI